jgi:phosphate:Na+ symporter
MDFGFFQLLEVLGALAFFIYGMKIMSEGIQLAAGSQLRNILRTMTRNRYLGVLTGFLTTAAVQSSSATTVMTVSFVNAGLITLVESAGIMMGANVGTTITGWLVSFLGFKIKLHILSLPLLAVGLPMTFITRGNIKHWGEFIIGFALLFMGLSFLKDSVPDINSTPEVLEFLGRFTEWGFLSRVFFVFVGALLTVIVQSSSASMTLTLTMCLNGWLPLDIGAAMVLGENIGTTITAELASLVGNTEAKRSARIHSIFNIIGVSWMILAMPFVLQGIANLLQGQFGMSDPYTSAESMPITVSAFHTAFNVLNVGILIWFVPWLVKLARNTVKEKEEDTEFKNQIEYFNNVIKTPELSVLEVQKGIAKFGEITSRMLDFTTGLIKSVDQREQSDLLDRIEKYEEITDRLDEEMMGYIMRLDQKETSDTTAIRLRAIMNICHDLETIGDLFYQISKNFEKKITKKRWFTPEQRNQLLELAAWLEKGFDTMIKNLNSPEFHHIDKQKAIDLHKQTVSHAKSMKKLNFKRMSDADYNKKTAVLYSDLYNAMARIADYQLQITLSIVGENIEQEGEEES